MNKLIELVEMAKTDAVTSDWPYGEAYFKGVIAHYNPISKRTTFTIDYKKATRKDVEAYLAAV